MTTIELAKALGVNVKTIVRWTRDPFRPLPHTRAGGRHLRFDADTLRRWLRRASHIRQSCDPNQIERFLNNDDR